MNDLKTFKAMTQSLDMKICNSNSTTLEYFVK